MFSRLIFFFIFCFTTIPIIAQDDSGTIISGELMRWHKITITFDGPEVSEIDAYNPFLNYRLEVVFSKNDTSFIVPGYFAGDGMSGESSANSGNKWRVHFAPPSIGKWNYNVSFKKGENIAVTNSVGESAAFMDGNVGSFSVIESDKKGRDFRSRGRLKFVNKSYLQFEGDGSYFLKAGADAPENLLSYTDFDGTFKNDGHKDDLVKGWAPHVRDWKQGDPVWKKNKGKGIIGAINYLAGKGMNAFSFLTLNIGGDDQNVFPYIDYDDYKRMDVSKLDQWEVLFEHADKLGMFLHFKTSEAENQTLLDNGDLGIERKLYYRELIARFGHHLALNWNIGEENGDWNVPYWTLPSQNSTQRLACAQYFHDNDPYRHHIVIHNGQHFYDLLGHSSKYTGLSLQTNMEDFSNVHGDVLKWKNIAKDAGKNWAIAVDEPGDHRYSLVPDKINSDHDNARQNGLWGALMAGAWGIEWYFGYENEHSDLSCEDWRSRDNMWNQSAHALKFFTENNIPFWEMEPSDQLTITENDYVLAKENDCYIIYLKMGSKEEVRLSGIKGEYKVRWYNPKSGTYLSKEEKFSIRDELVVDKFPKEENSDWIILIENINK